MENDNMSKEPIGHSKKSKDIVITRKQLKMIAFGLLGFICIFFVVIYFNSGLTHRKAKQVFIEYWNKTNSDLKLEEVKILGIKKLKTDTCRVKIQYSYLTEQMHIEEYLEKIKPDKAKLNYPEIFGDKIEKKLVLHKIDRDTDYIYTKWDTGWFIEEKKK